MAKPITIDEFLEKIGKSGLVDAARLEGYLDPLRQEGRLPQAIPDLARLLVQDAILTPFQCRQLLEGKWRRFWIGRYKVLDMLGSGRVGKVYLCEHKQMKRQVALRILPPTQAAEEAVCQQFYAEARKLAALDHPNISRIFDVDEFEGIHYLVMEHIEGLTLREILEKTGPMSLSGACHVIRQAALGLAHAEQTGMIHGAIHPGNIMVDMGGIVKVLNLSLIGITPELTNPRPGPPGRERLLEYRPPEQDEGNERMNPQGHVYGLGACLYYCLTRMIPPKDSKGESNRPGGQAARIAKIQALCPEVTDEFASCLGKMMATNPMDRLQTPQQVADALIPWTDHPHPHCYEVSPTDPLTAAVDSKVQQVQQSTSSKRTNPRHSRPPLPTSEIGNPKRRRNIGQIVGADTVHELSKAKTVPPNNHIPTKPNEDAESRWGKRQWTLVLGSVVGIFALMTLLILLPRQFSANTAVVPPAAIAPLLVNASGEKGTFKTLQDAIDKAAPLDTIEVQIPLEETVVLVNKYRLTIEGKAKDDKSHLVWKPPAQGFKASTKNSRLLEIGNCSSCKIKGFDFDCTGKATIGVNIWGECPGLHLEDLRIQNYTQAGVFITNASGSATDPIMIQALRFTPQASAFANKPSANGILFGILPGLSLRKISHVTIRDCPPPPKYTYWISNSAGSPMPENVNTDKVKIHSH